MRAAQTGLALRAPRRPPNLVIFLLSIIYKSYRVKVARPGVGGLVERLARIDRGTRNLSTSFPTGSRRKPRKDHATSEAIVFTPATSPQGRVIAQRGLAATAAAAIAGVLWLVPLAASAADAGTSTAVAALQPSGAAVADVPGTGETEIQAKLNTPGGLVIAGERLHADLLREFYAAHNYQPVWTSRQAQANALLSVVMRAGEHGLDPNLFHAAALANATPVPEVDRELLLSDAFLGFADALARGAVPIEARYDDEDLKPEPMDVAMELDRAIASPDPAAIIEALAPQTPAYKAMQQALRTYQSGAAATEPTTGAAGSRGRTAQQRFYGGGYRPGGYVNNEARLRQIMVNLERLRWLPRSMPPDRVVVNTANASLVLYRDDRPVFTTRVVVGETDKQTPELQTTIDSVLFNPPWNVPLSIARSEILPKLAMDPDYLSRHHMVYRRNGAIQQLPGPHAALGQIKFEMPNRFDVYLHDTPMKTLFSSDDRRRSHGCVRVQNPRELASLLLQEPVDAINKGVAVGYTHRRSLPSSTAVFFLYQTAFADADGRIEFRPDFYQRDDDIWQHLHRAPQVPMAEHQPPGERHS
jgi:murein L,D-transpeptidase YcbB/YkuD